MLTNHLTYLIGYIVNYCSNESVLLPGDMSVVHVKQEEVAVDEDFTTKEDWKVWVKEEPPSTLDFNDHLPVSGSSQEGKEPVPGRNGDNDIGKKKTFILKFS